MAEPHARMAHASSPEEENHHLINDEGAENTSLGQSPGKMAKKIDQG
jgi:hypothetical protein